ncbi:LacI family DNA-binding transcriptional regulator [Microlunatus parietis]|uniref:DNA-binding LacI/PurR family transcriptional regulator n=1 Tax=Microlunatus parietis TaxID=682979 RepID=A0A7Y9IDW3_9ACTN|nr:LacI family DNA-binding transcriptional regulator [Microlunatus parietis]NYE74796.1 DNA-binding LacI/PurR family transcriptional regulator [Microlunatus parietis]
MARRARTGPRRVSQADVARHAGVSPGIVSSVINGRDYGSIRVSDATRARVMESVRELGYVPDIAARNLAGGSSRLIGVFTYEALFPLGSQSFYHDFLVGIEEAADEAEYHLLLVTGAKNEDRRRSIYAGGVNHLRLADGGLLLGTNEQTDEIVRLAGEGYPFVFVGERSFPGVELSYVAGDYVGGTAALVGRAVELGHRRIAMAQLQPDEPIPGRQTGFRTGREQYGLAAEDAPLLPVSLGPTPGRLSLDDFLAEIVRRDITAVILENNGFVEPFRAAARERGLDIPADLSLIALGGTQFRPENAGLTELRIPRYEMGAEAVRLLLRLMADPSGGPLRTRLSCGILEGETLAPPPVRA